MEDGPLVSIVVMTYNSSEHVFETLESAKNQTYRHIELIITDDSSTDETVTICKDWINKNEDNFFRTELITKSFNTGTSANLNRGVKASTGKWFKPIAGDDSLKKSCIEENLLFIKRHSGINILVSECDFYDRRITKRNYIRTSNTQNYSIFKEPIDADKQFNFLLNNNCVCAPSFFIRKEVHSDLNGYDEEIKLLEDIPFLISATSKGYKIHCLNKATVNYRRSNVSASINRNSDFARSLMLYNEKYRKAYVSFINYTSYKIWCYLILLVNYIEIDKDSLLAEFIFRVIKVVKPHYWINEQ